VAKPVEDVFLLTGELRAVRSESLITPRGEGELQIRWMAEDGAEIPAGGRVAEFDAARLIQTIEERRLRLRQAENDRESRERQAAAETERKRVAVDKAEVEAEKARIDAVVPKELRPAVEWARFQATWQERKAALEKARLEQEAYTVSSRSDVATARAAEEKARRQVEAAEKSLGSMSLLAPRAGIFLVGNFWQWGPEGPRKLQPATPCGPATRSGRCPTPRRWRYRPPSRTRTTGASRRAWPPAASSTRTPTGCSRGGSRRSGRSRSRAAGGGSPRRRGRASRCASRSRRRTR
jgi:multidrug efflux pump subunit AcrA (membrane-fusion protein)